MQDGEWSVVTTLEGHENEVKCCAWAASGTVLATCGRDKTVWIWETGDTNAFGEDEDSFECVAVLTDHTQDVKHVAWHPSEQILASGGYDNLICLFHNDGDEWASFATLSGHTSTVWDVAFSASGVLASASDDTTVRLWKLLPDGKWGCAAVLAGYHTRTVYSVAWSAASLLASAAGDNTIVVFAESEGVYGVHAASRPAHAQDVNAVAWCPSNPLLLASVSDDGSVRLWDVPSL